MLPQKAGGETGIAVEADRASSRALLERRGGTGGAPPVNRLPTLSPLTIRARNRASARVLSDFLCPQLHDSLRAILVNRTGERTEG